MKLALALVLAQLVSASKEAVLHQTIPLACSAHWDIGASSMQNIAYRWTHQHKIKGWQYTSVEPPSFPAIHVNNPAPAPRIPPQQQLLDCVHITYDTSVQVPRALSTYIPNNVLKTNVTKEVCASSEHLSEHVRFSNIIMLGSFSLQLESTIDNDKHTAVFDSSCEITLPWFSLPLKGLILKHLQQSVVEYMHLLADSLCD